MSNKTQLQTNNINLASYTDRVNALVEVANGLPEAGVNLPELTSPATAEEIFLNKQTIDEDGNIITGAFTIDSELETQDGLITQIMSALEGKASGNNSENNDDNSSISNNTITILNNTGAEMIIGSYKLLHGESVKTPYNVPVSSPLIFVTKLPVDTVINSNGAMFSTRTTTANVSFNDITGSTTVTFGTLMLSSSVVNGSIVDIYTQ